MHELEQNVQVLLPIKCLEFELLNSPSDEDLKIFVLAATANPIRLYKFLGNFLMVHLSDKVVFHLWYNKPVWVACVSCMEHCALKSLYLFRGSYV